MGSRRTGMLICGLVLIGASTASAEGRDWSVGYVTQTSVTETVTKPISYRRYPSDTFIELMSKPFAPLLMSSDTDWNVAYHDFRRPDPEIALPKAFRRPEQVRIGFSFRF